MSNIMRAPDLMNIVTIPLNGRTLQDNDCIVVICPDDSTKNALGVYKAGNWVEIGDSDYYYSIGVDSVIVHVNLTFVPHHYYACFLPSPVSS